MSRHRNDYKRHKNGLRGIIAVFELFDEFGVKNCKIELVENYPCKNKEDLLKREGWFIQNTTCVNKHKTGRTYQQYREDRKEHIKEVKQQSYRKNIDTIKARQKEYYEQNKEQVFERIKQQCSCECGYVYTYGHKARHQKTKRHQQYLQSLENID